MIGLHIAKLLETLNFGTLDTDIFYEEVTLDGNGVPKQGLWVVERGSTVTRFNSRIQQVDIYSRYNNKLTGAKKLEQILNYFADHYNDICTLPAVEPYSSEVYSNIRIVPVSSLENVGADENGKIIRVISIEVTYS